MTKIPTVWQIVEPKQLHKHEVEWLLDACSQSTYEFQFKDLLELQQAGLYALIRWTGDFTGLMVVKVNKYPGGKELFVWHLAGAGLRTRRTIGLVLQKTKEIAKQLGCRWVGAEAKRRAIARVYGHFARARAVAFVTEVK